MSSNTDSTSEPFLDVAVAHGLLPAGDVERIRAHAMENNMLSSDAVLSLSMMKPWEVEATLLLADPTGFAPGFRLTGLIGSGAAGLVFRAHQTNLARDIALKTINMMSRSSGAKGESRIQREAQAIARLQHPNIVAAYDSGFHQGRFWISMEFVEGETLADFIDREAPVSEPVVLNIIRQASSALDHARHLGIIHRDIKPANLLLCKPPAGASQLGGVPFVKVADFGLAFDSMHEGDHKLTATGATLGTPAFIAPEQLQNTRVDCRADIYSLGTTVFHMLTGQIPWAGRSPMKAILDKTVGDDRWRDGFPKSASPALTSLFLDMTATNAEDRIPDYVTLINRIDSEFSGRHLQAIGSGAVGQRGSLRWVKKVLAAVSLGAVVVGLSALAIWWNGDSQTSKPEAVLQSEPVNENPWEPVGLPYPLFNGTSFPLKHVASVGTWTPERAEDGSGVLAGGQGSSLSIPLKTPVEQAFDLSLRLSVHVPDQASAAELFLEKVTTTAGVKSREVLQTVSITDHSASLFEGEGTTSPPAMTLNLSRSSPEDVLFRRIQVQRAGSLLLLLINGQQVVKSSWASGGEYQLRIRCSRGTVSLADMSMTELRQKTADAK
ncbi:MAG: serine/threonine-protein kinase [Fuerstiella sp.]